jgi:hypothetical protein
MLFLCISLFIIIIVFLNLLTMYMSITKKHKKIVVFDMDETLGCFVQLGMFTEILEHNIKRKLTNEEFNILMDLFPLYQRPNILSILNYIKQLKEKKQCYKVYIYTNNQGPKHWALQIKTYFETKINYPLFDKVIHAYKVNGVQIEKNRTSHTKSVSDLLKCTKLSKNTSICFLDDQYHHYMLKSNTYYLHVNEYHYYYEPNDLFEQFKIHFQLNENYIHFLKQTDKHIFLEYNNHTKNCLTAHCKEHNNKISKKIVFHLQYFFDNFNNKYTQKRELKQNKTQKYTNTVHYKKIH